ncbi:nucleotidyl transferase AbiEii/AbiGii toxin family protein [bacterium]|nr:nucleotidyl transferase AbiEii/AbiGii toxin family protein [bacterium]
MTETRKKNPAASIHARLLNISRDTGQNFNALINRFFQERFLARLSISDYHETFILKGGLLLAAESITQFRPTIDIDMLAVNIMNNVDIVRPIIKKIAQIDIPDCVIFNTGDMIYEVLKEDDEYEGIRFKFSVSLGKIKSRIQLDIGFGDEVPTGFTSKAFPVFLGDLEAPVLLTYPLESVIAEKFQAIVYLGDANSRMKDFYDILFLAKNNEFSMPMLHSAITATFYKRKTDIKKCQFIYEDKYINLKTGLWNTYLRKIDDTDAISFQEVVSKIERFIEPVIRKSKTSFVWSPQTWDWSVK